MNPTEKVVKVVEILRGIVPELDPPIHRMFEIQKDDPYRVLVCGILSARSKDEKTVPVCRKLFEKYPDAESLLKAPLEDIEETLKGIGLYRQKARYLKEAVRLLVEQYNGKLPDRLEELVKFPGVGRKIANIILIHAFGKDTIAVDTHVHRIANLLGLVSTKTPEQTERELKKITPKALWREINYLLVGFGQTICKPKNPDCKKCPIKELCEFYKKNGKGFEVIG
jgi:endonuclease-3